MALNSRPLDENAMKTTLVSFLWHMHQPDYRLPGQPLSLLPWVRLHATKAYYDMP